jgi:hypothetical protein
MIEVLGQARQYEYVEFLAAYAPSDVHNLDNYIGRRNWLS